MVALAATPEETVKRPEAFWIVFGVCVVQIVVFVIYIIVRRWSEDPVDRNYVQIALNTLSLLIEICRCLYKYASASSPSSASGGATTPASILNQYLWSALAMIVLWLLCICFWLKYLAKTAIKIPIGNEPLVQP